jgi:hypothetical protein
MNKSLGIALLVVGLIVMMAGYHASQSFSSDLSRFFTGAATDKSIWMLAGGAVAAIAGVFLLNRRSV